MLYFMFHLIFHMVSFFKIKINLINNHITIIKLNIKNTWKQLFFIKILLLLKKRQRHINIKYGIVIITYFNNIKIKRRKRKEILYLSCFSFFLFFFFFSFFFFFFVFFFFIFYFFILFFSIIKSNIK